MSKRKWTDAQIETILALVAQGRSGPSISAETGIPAPVIRKLCAARGVKLRRTRNTDSQIRAKLDREAFRIWLAFADSRCEPLGHVKRLALEIIAYENLLAAIFDGGKAKPKPKHFGWPAGVPRKTAAPPPEPLPRGNAYSAPMPKVAPAPVPTSPPPSLPPPPVSIASLAPRLEGQIEIFVSP